MGLLVTAAAPPAPVVSDQHGRPPRVRRCRPGPARRRGGVAWPEATRRGSPATCLTLPGPSPRGG